ncbi:MAG: lysylphosphatidylglycerol synthase transmembrane domain-containing protein [Bacteroidota bacterium]
MSKPSRTSQVLKLLLSLSLGVGIILLIYFNLTASDIETIKTHIFKADYGWIAFSLFLHLVSHVSRAWRWRYTLEAVDIYPRFSNSFFSVMIGYLVNLAFPRAGEASRCAALARYERAPFDKLFGTVIAERVADLAMLFLIVLGVSILQFDRLNEILNRDLHTDLQQADGIASIQGDTLMESFLAKIPSLQSLILIAVLGIVILGLGFWFLQKSSHPLGQKIKNILKGLWEGIQSIFFMKKKGLFILHTLIIWSLYILMFWVAMFSLEGTRNVVFPGVLAAFIMGTLGIVLVQGGLGAYPFLVMLALSIYGVDRNEGLAFGWINWTAQTLLVIFIGLLAFILIPQINKESKKET